MPRWWCAGLVTLVAQHSGMFVRLAHHRRARSGLRGERIAKVARQAMSTTTIGERFDEV